MVFIPERVNVPRLTCYLLAVLSHDELKDVKSAFELGTCARFIPCLELKIIPAPEDYQGKSHEYIRTKENQAGRTDPFVLIDDLAVSKGSVWYVARFANQEEVDEDLAESTSVLWKILVKTEYLALTWVNYDIANMSIEEDLGNRGVDFPVQEGFEQPEILTSGLDMHKQHFQRDTWVIAEPGEFEESTDNELRRNFFPMPDKVARLKEDVAEAAGLINEWTIASKASPVKMSDGSKRTFPEGSVILHLLFNPDFPSQYEWPEGSL